MFKQVVNFNPQKNRLIFLHIPKTAGSTLNSILTRKYKSSDIYSIYPTSLKDLEKKVRDFQYLSPKKRENIRLLRGHINFGLHKYLPNSMYITLLRDPVQRVISHYYYVRRDSNHYLHKTIVSKKMSLEEYVSSGIATEIDNGQVRQLSQIKSDFGECTQEMLQDAKANINKYFLVVGTQNRFDEFLILLKQKLNWQFLPVHARINTGNYRQNQEIMSNSTLKIIEKYNELDLELYEFASQKFDDLFSQFCDSYFTKIELNTLALLNKPLNSMYSQLKFLKLLYKNAESFVRSKRKKTL